MLHHGVTQKLLKINKRRNRYKIYGKQRFCLVLFRVFPSASRCLYRANALPVSVRVCGTALEYLLSNHNVAFSFFSVFFPFPFLQPMVSPRNLPAWTTTLVRYLQSLEDGGRREIYMC